MDMPNGTLTTESHDALVQRTIDLSERIAALEAENAALKADLAAARQSRARLVRLVRELRVLHRITLQSARDWKERAEFHLQQRITLEASGERLVGQRDDARAWAAAWKRGAKWWRDYGAAWWLHNGSSNRTKATASFRTVSRMRRPLNRAMGLNCIGPNEESDAARRAAEAMEKTR